MANLTEAKFREELQKGKLRALYVVVGADPFKLNHYATAAERILFPDSSSATREILYGDELEPHALLESSRSLSLWSPHRFILVKQAEKINAKGWEALSELLENPPERCTIFFQSTKADGRIKFFQLLAKASDDSVQIKLEPSIGPEWNKWLQIFLKENGKELAPEALPMLREWTDSLGELRHWIERASLYAGSASQIRAEHIKAVGYRTSPEDIFQLSGAILAGDRAAVLGFLETMLKQGEEPIALVGLIARQYRWLLSILAMRAEGKSDNEIITDCGIYPAAAKVLFPAARRLGGRGVLSGLAALASADHSLKSSRLPGEHVLTKLALSLTA